MERRKRGGWGIAEYFFRWQQWDIEMKKKVGEWAGWEQWDFDFMLITSKDRL